MGGYGSGGHNRRHVTVDASVRIDAAMLRRAGLIEPDTLKGSEWNFTQSRGARYRVIGVAGPATPGEIILTIVTANGERHSQQIRVSFTPCNYGKRRAWPHCPKCGRRIFRLFYYPHTYSGDRHLHYFACRHCYGLTYDLRRERGFSLWQDRALRLQKKLAERSADCAVLSWRELPNKPKGMRWATYSRLATKFQRAAYMGDSAFIATVSRLLGDKF
jgi:hypothetical protein